MNTSSLPAASAAARGPASTPTPQPLGTWPNLVTLVRTVLAVAVGSAAVARADLGLLAAAYAIYWVGDVADGWLARRLDQETRAGAVFDIIGDRACTVLLCAGLLAARPDAWLVVAVFLVSFAVVDTMLSLSFLPWDLLGPNDFHRVDRAVWLLNWSPVAKASNTAGVAALVLFGAYSAALVLALAILGAEGLVGRPGRVPAGSPTPQGRLGMSTATAALAVLAAGAMGVGSALVPFVNAEAYAVVTAGAAPAVLVVLALATGQTVGKVVLFESARRGAARWTPKDPSARRGRWLARVTPWLKSPRTGPPLVLVSSTLGLPPLAVVSVAAGASGQRRLLFAALVLAGRLARFAAIVIPASHLTL